MTEAVAVERPLNTYVIHKSDAVRLDRVWQVCMIYTDGTVELYPMGGGNVYRIPKEKMDDLRPIDPWEEIEDLWIPGLFIIPIAEEDPALRGFHKRQRWNGFACPVVLDEDVKKLSEDWEQHFEPKHPDECCRLRKVNGVWQLYQWYEDDSEDLDKNWHDQTRHDVEFNGKTYECWDIGTWNLCWHDVEHDWLTKPVVAKELPTEYEWIANQGCNGRQMNGVHHPPALVDCWVKCTCPVCS